MSKKQFLISEKYIELLFGLGASIVIIGALLKITHKDLGPISGNTMLTIGLITEAVIFAIAGIRGYYESSVSRGSNEVGEDGIPDMSQEIIQLKESFAQASSQMTTLTGNVAHAATATKDLIIPENTAENINSFNANIEVANKTLNKVNELYGKVENSLTDQPQANIALMNSSINLKDQIEAMNNSIKELNDKYAALVNVMSK